MVFEGRGKRAIVLQLPQGHKIPADSNQSPSRDEVPGEYVREEGSPGRPDKGSAYEQSCQTAPNGDYNRRYPGILSRNKRRSMQRQPNNHTKARSDRYGT
jgi:hypothetical protein